MAATTTASSPHFHKKPTTTLKFRRRRRFKETTISAGATAPTTTHHPSVVSPENNSWCCPSAVSSYKHPPPPPPPPPPPESTVNPKPVSDSPVLSPSPESLSSDSPSNLGKVRSVSSRSYLNLGKPQSMTPTAAAAAYVGAASPQETFPGSFSNFNTALTAGILSPPPPPADKTRSSPTLFEMMANEPDSKIPNNPNGNVPITTSKKPNNNFVIIDKQALIQQRLLDLLSCRSPGSQFNDPNSSDLKLTLSSKEGPSVSMDVHRQILVAHSRFFAVKLSENRGKLGQQNGFVDDNSSYIVEVADCDEIEVYIESIKLMYCKDLRRKLMEADVPRVLGILKVSAAIGFDAGVLSCLEYLEAAPWTEDEEQNVTSLLSELHLDNTFGAVEVLRRVSLDSTSNDDNEQVIVNLIHTVLDAKDEKARREMKTLVSKMLRDDSNPSPIDAATKASNPSPNGATKESLYSACEKCLVPLRTHLSKASKGEIEDFSQISRQSDNLHWLLDILIDRKIAEEFLKIWASERELSEAHCKVAAIHRHEISRVTARLFVAIGKGQLLATKDSKCLLLETWLGPFYDDFAWMRRGLDRNLVEEGLSNTILTLPLCWQREILMGWFDRFVNCGEDCPNLQRGFEVWWRRSFWRK